MRRWIQGVIAAAVLMVSGTARAADTWWATFWGDQKVSFSIPPTSLSKFEDPYNGLPIYKGDTNFTAYIGDMHTDGSGLGYLTIDLQNGQSFDISAEDGQYSQKVSAYFQTSTHAFPLDDPFSKEFGVSLQPTEAHVSYSLFKDPNNPTETVTGELDNFNFFTLTKTQQLGDVPTVGAVPEPATWAMMIVGFAAIGVGMRRRRSNLLPTKPQIQASC